MKDNGIIRTSSTGANRDSSINKIEVIKSISPLVIEDFCKYMLENGILANGSRRPCDNWKKGFGESYEETEDICSNSLGRHFLDFWKEHDGFKSRDGLRKALGGIFFNTMGYWDAMLKAELEQNGTILRDDQILECIERKNK